MLVHITTVDRQVTTSTTNSISTTKHTEICAASQKGADGVAANWTQNGIEVVLPIREENEERKMKTRCPSNEPR